MLIHSLVDLGIPGCDCLVEGACFVHGPITDYHRRFSLWHSQSALHAPYWTLSH